MTPTLETVRLLLAALRVSDAAARAAAETDPVLFTHIGGAPPTAAELEERIRRYNEGPNRPGEAWHNWAIRLRETREVIGHFQATVREHGASVELAWLVGTPWQGRGYATEAAQAVVDWLLAPPSSTRELIAHVHPANAASAKVAQRLRLEPTEIVQDDEIRWRRVIEVAPGGG